MSASWCAALAFIASVAILGAGCARREGNPAEPREVRRERLRQQREAAAEQLRPVVMLRSDTLQLTPEVIKELDPTMEFRLGIEKEADEEFPNLRSRRLTVFVNGASLDNRGVHTLDTLTRARLVSLAKVVVLDDGEAGASLALQEWLEKNENTTVYTLGPETFIPTEEMYRHSDAIVWDVALSGPRDSLETAALSAALEKASLAQLPFFVLDRPSIMSDTFVEGPPADPEFAGSRKAYFPLVPFPGMTAGELATFVDTQYGLHGRLTVVPMENWRRVDHNQWLYNAPTWEVTEMGLRNLRELQQSVRYQPGYVELRAVNSLTEVPLFTGRELSMGEEGRPQLRLEPSKVDASTMHQQLAEGTYLGLEIAPVPSVEEAEAAQAVVLKATAEGQIFPLEVSMSLWMAALSEPSDFPREESRQIFATRVISQALARGLTPDQTRRRWMVSSSYQNFLAERERVLLYQP